MSKKLPLFPSDLDDDERLMFLALAASDMLLAKHACELALQHGREREEQSATYLAFAELAIVRYAKPFCANHLPGRVNRVKLPESYVLDHPQAREIHNISMTMRHRAFAHRDLRVGAIRLERSSSRNWLSVVRCVSLSPRNLEGLRQLSDKTAIRILDELSAHATATYPEVEVGGSVSIYTAPLDRSEPSAPIP